jgi:adenylate kinase
LRVVFLGPPGSGKGTQAARLAAAAGVPHIATGDIFRRHVQEGTPLGVTARRYMDRGENVPDDLTIAMVRERLAEPDASAGFVLDGFPRTLPQAEALDALLAELGQALGHAVYLRVDDEEVVGRLSGRRTCPSCGAVYHLKSQPPRRPDRCDACGAELRQRDDDREEVVRRRLAVYRAQTLPLLPYYAAQGKLREIDGHRPVEAVAAAVRAAVGLDGA